MIRIVFCDDEKNIREKYTQYLEKVQQLYTIEIDLTVYSKVDHLMGNIEDWFNKVDLLLLDIEIGDFNGVEVAKDIRAKGYKGEIVFLTISQAYVFDSFDVNPLQYILKSEGDFQHFYDKFVKVLDQIGERYIKKFSYQIGSDTFILPIKQIISFEVKKRVIIMDYVNKEDEYQTVEYYMTLGTVEERISEMEFIRCHRSFIVNPKYIDSFNKREVVMINGKVIPVSRNYFDDAKDKFVNYLEFRGVHV